MKDKNLCLKKPCTLGASNHQFSSKGGGDISCSYAFLGICEAGCPFFIREVYTDMRFHTIGLYP